MRAVVHQLAELSVSAAGDKAALGDHQDSRSEPGDFLEHMGRHEHAAPLRAQFLEQLDHATSLNGIEAVERLIQDQHLRIVNERGGQLRALTHALGIARHRPMIVGVEFDDAQRVSPRRFGVRHTMRGGCDRHEFERVEPVEQSVLLR